MESAKIKVGGKEIDISKLDPQYRYFIEFFLNRKKPRFWYEKLVKKISSFFNLGFCPEPLRSSYDYSIWVSKLRLKPEEIFSTIVFLTIASLIISGIAFFLNRDIGIGFLVTFLTGIGYLAYYPKFYEKVVKIEATSQAIWTILFLVLYLKRIPNLENAIRFVAYYGKGPIAEDFTDMVIEMEEKKFSDIGEAIKKYSKRWVEWNRDFVYSMNLLLITQELKEQEKINFILDRALNWIIKQAHMKTREYSVNLQTPVRLVTFFLIMMPLISLIMVPIVSVFLFKEVSLTLLFYFYTVFLPFLSFLILQMLISERPFAFTTPDLSLVPDLPKEGYFKIGSIELPALIVAALALFIAIPGLFHLSDLTVAMLSARTQEELSAIAQQEYALANVLLSYTVVLGLGLFFGLYFYLKSFQRVKKAKELEEMEEELPIALYEIGNILEEGLPLEIVFYRAYKNYKLIATKGKLENLFKITILNLSKGMTIDEAIFDKKKGAARYYPSKLIREVLNLLVHSARKGVEALSQIANKLSVYLENINEVKHLIRELLAEVVDTLKMASNVLIAFIGGLIIVFQKIVITMLWQLIYILKVVDDLIGSNSYSGLAESFKRMFNLDKLLPPTVFAVIIGIYIIEAIILTAYFSSGIEYGFDKVRRDYEIGKGLLISMVLLTIMVLAGLAIMESFFGAYMPSLADLNP